MSCVDKMLRGETMELSSCTQKWNFLYVKDAVKQIYLLCLYALKNPECKAEVFNIASKDTRVLKDFVQEIYMLSNSNSILNFDVVRPTNVVSLDPDISKTEAATDFISDYVFKDVDFAKNFKQSKPNNDHWHTVYRFPGKGAELNIKRLQKRSSIAVEFYIHDNKQLYDRLAAHQEEINATIGASPEWQRLDDKKACRVQLEKEFPIDDEENWPEEFIWTMEFSRKFKQAFEKFI
jgi:hypothetical protein